MLWLCATAMSPHQQSPSPLPSGCSVLHSAYSAGEEDTMLNNSVIKTSGQLWKLSIAITGLIFGSVAPLFPGLGITMTVGTIIALAAYVFGIITIRCNDCSSLWLWEATKDAGWYAPLFKKTDCPACHKEFP
jgi:hypothetical protein